MVGEYIGLKGYKGAMKGGGFVTCQDNKPRQRPHADAKNQGAA